MLESLNFGLIGSSLLLAFGKSVKAIFSLFDAKNDPYVLAPFVTSLDTSYDGFAQSYKREISNPFTKRLLESDEKRDRAYYCYRDYVASCVFMEEADQSAAADRLVAIMHKHGWSAPSHGYKAETAAITKVVNETRDLNTSDVELLNATSRFDRLVTRETEFEELQKSSYTSPDKGLPTIVSSRPKLEKAIRRLLDMVDNHYSEKPADATLGGYVKALNELITATMSTARAAQTREENKEKEEGK